MKRKPPKRKVIQLFGENRTKDGISAIPAEVKDTGSGREFREESLEDLTGMGSLHSEDIGILDTVPGLLGESADPVGGHDVAGLSGTSDAGSRPQVLNFHGRKGQRSSRGTMGHSSGSEDNAGMRWHILGKDADGSDLNDLLELLAVPGPDSDPAHPDRSDGPILSFPTLDRILGRLGTAVSRRLYALTTRRWVVISNTAKRVHFSAWSRFQRPVASTFNLFPLEGAALMGADCDLVRLLTARLLDRGPERRFGEDHNRVNGTLQSLSSQAVAAHCLHVFQLDLEWALAPFFEVETTRGRVILPEEPIIEFGEEEECVLSTFSVSDGEYSGRFMLLFPADMLRPLEMLLASSSKVLMPASTETDDEVFLRLRTLSDEKLTEMLEQSHPLLASVVLYRMSEDRRLRILQGMPKELQEELVRRMGRRASVLRTLSLEQRVAARCLLMGEGYTSHILRMCTPEAAARFLGTVGTLPSLFPSQAAEICGEENPGLTCGSTLVVDKGTITRLLMRSFSSETFVLVSKLLAEGAHALPFDSLVLCNPEHIASLLMHETYGVGGLVLRHLLRKAPDVAAAAFALLDSGAQPAVLERVIMPRSVDVDIVHTVENALCEHIPLACKAVESASEREPKARCAAHVCFSDAQILMSRMDTQVRIELVRHMERSGIPMPSDSLNG